MRTRLHPALLARLPVAACAAWLLLAAAAATAQVDDIRARRAAQKAALDQATAEFRARIPQDAYVPGPDGQPTIDPKRPDVQKLEAEWRARMDAIRAQHSTGDTRFDDLARTMKEAGVADGKVANSGSRPKTINSDMDMTELAAGEGRKVAEALSKKGYEVQELPDRWVVKQTDTTIWKKPDTVEIGSPEHRAQARRAAAAEDVFPTKGGVYATTGGQQGTLDPEGAVLANAKKFSDACGSCDPATRLADIDGHTIGKSVSKAAEWTATKADSEFFRQADALRNHRSWEEAGVCHPSDPPEVKAQKVRNFLDQAQDHLARAAEAGARQSRSLDDVRTAQAADADVRGDLETSAKLRDQQIDTKVGNQETMRRLAEVDPKLAARLNGTKLTVNADGTFTNAATGETLTPSQVREAATAPASRDLVATTEKVVQATEAAPKVAEAPPKPVEGAPKPVEGEGPAAGRMGGAMKAGGYGVLAYGVYEGVKTGAEMAVAEERPDDWSIKTYGKAWAYSALYASGIGGAWDTGKQAGLDSAAQFRKDLEAGKEPSAAWAKARAVLWGVGGFVKGMTVDPLVSGVTAVKEGIGVVTDSVEARRMTKEAEAAVAATKAQREARRSKALAAGGGAAGQAAGGAAAGGTAVPGPAGTRTGRDPPGTARPGTPGRIDVDVDRLVATAHTLENLTELVRALAERAVGDESDPDARARAAAALFEREFPGLRRAWEQKRLELKREYIALVSALRGASLAVEFAPKPPELPADGRPLEVTLEAVFPGFDAGRAVDRMNDLLELLAGAVPPVEVACQFKGAPAGPSTRTSARFAKPGRFETTATVTFTVSSAGLSGENTALATSVSRSASVAFEVVPAGASGSFAGTFQGEYGRGAIRFTIAGTTVAGTVGSSVIQAQLQGTYDPRTQALAGTVSGTQAIPMSATDKPVARSFSARIEGRYSGGGFRGTYAGTSSGWSDHGTWTAAGKLGGAPGR